MTPEARAKLLALAPDRLCAQVDRLVTERDDARAQRDELLRQLRERSAQRDELLRASLAQEQARPGHDLSDDICKRIAEDAGRATIDAILRSLGQARKRMTPEQEQAREARLVPKPDKAPEGYPTGPEEPVLARDGNALRKGEPQAPQGWDKIEADPKGAVAQPAARPDASAIQAARAGILSRLKK